MISVGGAPLDTIETVILPRKGKTSYAKIMFRGKAEVKKFKPNLVHIHYVAGNGLLGLCAGVHPMVASVWGSDIDKNANSVLVNWISQKVLINSNHITVTSNFLKKQTEKRLGQRSKPISVIPFGVEIPIEVTPATNSGTFKICFIKEHKPVYGGDILIKALSKVARAVPYVRLSMVGHENEYTTHLKSLVSKFNLERQVSFKGFINHKEVPSLISEHHLLVMPSISEGFGVVAAEAAACGRPVVATYVGGIPEIVIDGKTGLLVPPNDSDALADAIIKLANDANLCHKMGQAGHEFVKEHFKWEHSLDLMSELYERLTHAAQKA